MKQPSLKSRTFRFRDCRVYKVLVAALLVGFLGLEMLSLGVVECTPAAPGEQGGLVFRVESLQVCNCGDSFLGILSDLPVLLPGGPNLFPSPVTVRLHPESAVPIPDGFLPAIDHPPQLSAQL